MKRFAQALLLAALPACSPREAPVASAPPPSALNVVGPFCHENLALYLILDPAAKSQGEFITLEEGLKAGAVKVSEKTDAQVSELLIENSSDKPCFVQAGDVVQGGKQDRTIASDFIIPSKTPATPVKSFCVEQSRWHGGKAFDGAAPNVNTQSLKLATQYSSSQGEVWDKVAKAKMELRENNALSASETSSVNEEYQKPKIVSRRKEFAAALGKIADAHPQAVGLAWAINGKFVTADLYTDPGLFRKMFPRILDSSALEAIGVAAVKEAKAPEAVACADFLRKAGEGSRKDESLNADLKKCTLENAETLRFEYHYQGKEVHRQSHKR